jgi:hypothetical protein
VRTFHAGHPGRPRKIINKDWLAWASGLRSTSAIGRFLGLSHSTVRSALLEYGLRQPLQNPVRHVMADDGSLTFEQVQSYTSLVSAWTDNELDLTLAQLLRSHPTVGNRMAQGYLRSMGQVVPTARICASLHWLDPRTRVFRQRPVVRHRYRVPGPMAS